MFTSVYFRAMFWHPIMTKKYPRVLAISMLAALLTGCMVGPDFSTPDARLQNSYDLPVPTEFTEGTQVDIDHAIDPVAWWGSFKDPVLLELLAKSAQQNLSLQAAAVQVYQARAQLGITDASLLPKVNATGSATPVSYTHLTLPTNREV